MCLLDSYHAAMQVESTKQLKCDDLFLYAQNIHTFSLTYSTFIYEYVAQFALMFMNRDNAGAATSHLIVSNRNITPPSAQTLPLYCYPTAANTHLSYTFCLSRCISSRIACRGKSGQSMNEGEMPTTPNKVAKQLHA